MMATIATGIALLSLACLSACTAIIAYACAVKIIDGCLSFVGLN